MNESLDSLYRLLIDMVLPNLHSIESSQAESRAQNERLRADLKAFRSEMQLRFAEMRADIALCRQEFEAGIAAMREKDASAGEPAAARKKTQIH